MKYSGKSNSTNSERMEDEIKLQASMIHEKYGASCRANYPLERDIISVYSLYFTCFPSRAISRSLRRFAN